jgi:HisA/HisF family protein
VYVPGRSARPFEVLGVIDLRGGLAVRARGGQREKYSAIERVAGESIPPGDATAVARQYVDRFGLSSLYLADLDAIEQRVPQREVIRTLQSVGVPLWVDAGIASPEDAESALGCGASRLIVGLETLPSYEALESICQRAGSERVAFSLDLRGGAPLTTVTELARQRPEDLAARAADAGVYAVIVLDLARVGTAAGLDLERLARVRTALSSVRLYAAGGIRNVDDIEQAQRVGCDGALVAYALLDGQLTKHDLDLHRPLTPKARHLALTPNT